ncbi:GFA family protein [Streptomyces sp. FXJ1.4098]|nr:GFA family protein [Streptomyces sp. FXJ1.4098]
MTLAWAKPSRRSPAAGEGHRLALDVVADTLEGRHGTDLCSCLHCQKLAGAPLMWWAGFAPYAVTWTGEGWADLVRVRGEAKCGFCPCCGSRLAIDSDTPEIGSNVTELDQRPRPRTGQPVLP